MDGQAILAPVIALICWTMVMWLWMYATRVPAMQRAEGLDVNNMVGGVGTDLDKILPAKIQWIAQNYNHLHENPTIFYALALTLAMLGAGDGNNLMVAWAYVGIRIVHSLVQVLWNRIVARFTLFLLSGFAIIYLAIQAALIVLL